jgi:membrane-associated protein
MSMILFGYYALAAADELVRRVTGKPDFTFAKHLDKIVIVIVLASVAPMVVKAYKKWRSTRQQVKV